MIIAMAVGGYRYNPNAKKSKITQEIVHDADKLGITIDPDTVRKWLKESAEHIPFDDYFDEL